ncbi:MAG: glycoside hydrolase family 29 (alpha-L-fucosidase) [Acidobacteriaceae bacterium]|nr:glycoside hydrolase family 29 (alpha-L-fucosidase) [Acidobacteriaceae bacterium]
MRELRRTVVVLVFLCFHFPGLNGQQASHYAPSLDSLNRHPIPQWYGDAKLGIFVHWGLYSVPGWAPLVHPEHDFTSQDYITHNPYAEWYLNSMRLDGSPTQAYHREHYGADYSYYNFAPTFNREIQKWNPDLWAEIFRRAGAKYVVLTTKHHDGFTLWPSSVQNPTLALDRQHAQRDLVGELSAAVRKQGLRMGLYYSGGYDWTFVPGPIRISADYEKVKPQSETYGKYVDAHYRELIERYHPAVLWNDIDYPKSGHPLQIMAEYYNAVPDGVIDDRFGVKHSDFKSPEYETLDKISPTKWEECRGLGRSFGYNRAEGEAETIAPNELIYLLVDIVSKNGNLLLDVGPEADGTIPPVQMSRLEALGSWLGQNGEAIYGTRPWERATGETSGGIQVRFTAKDSSVYATVLGKPAGATLTLKSFPAKASSKFFLLGLTKPLSWSQHGDDTVIELPSTLPGRYAYVIKMVQP